MLTVILTGGRSRRMGRDKALLPLPSGPVSLVLARRYAALGPVAFAVDTAGRFDCGGFPELADSFPGRGPLNGLYSGFRHFDEELLFLTATDMPCGDPALARLLAGRIGTGCACVIERANGFLEPLFAVYHRRTLPLVEECLRTGRCSLREIFERLPVTLVPETRLDAWDMERVLCNINTPETWARFLAQDDGRGAQGDVDAKADN